MSKSGQQDRQKKCVVGSVSWTKEDAFSSLSSDRTEGLRAAWSQRMCVKEGWYEGQAGESTESGSTLF